MKGNFKEWFDSVVSEEINNRETNHFKKFKKSRLTLDQSAHYEVRKLIAEKKRNSFNKKITENIGKPQEMYKTLKALALSNKVSTATINAPKDEKVLKGYLC